MLAEINTESTLLPEYEQPPINEVICGISFKPLDAFTASHMGILWGRLQPDYPRVEELVPLGSPIEIFQGHEFKPEFQYTPVPPLPREMFISTDENYVIQIQRDRFIFNWRKLKTTDMYPRYTQVTDQFEKRYSLFEEVATVDGDVPEPIQYELTYNNQIPQGDIWQSISDIGKIFPYINLKFNGLILGEPEFTIWRTSFVLPGKTGRLHLVVRTNGIRRSDNSPLIFFELTVRGIPTDISRQARKVWFDSAREWIVKGFTDFTSEEAQNEIWRRIQ